MKFILDFFALITGIGVASGLHYHDGRLFIVSDNSNYLYEYHIGSKVLNKHLLLNSAGKNEQVEKKDKMDLESITFHTGNYTLFPSGSEVNRAMSFDLKSDDLSSINRQDLSKMYLQIRDFLQIPTEDFNIEGALFYQDTLLLFNRGNGPGKINGVIKIPNEKDLIDINPVFFPIKLPEINGQATGFTDAILVNDKIYFLAAAEDGDSNYSDGKISGTQFGIINPVNLKLEKVEIISYEHKFEGITLYQSTKRKDVFLLCEDPDNDQNSSTIYRLEINK